jgi:uncharacterized alpha-E superfamily protein
LELGRTFKDVWVLSEGPVAPVTLLPPRPSVLELRRSSNDLPSRVADNLYWLGRHIERAEGLVRLLRSCVVRLTSEPDPENMSQVAGLLRVLSDGAPSPLGADGAAPTLENLRNELLSLLFAEARPGGCWETLRGLYRTASFVRDRLSLDTWRIISRLDLDFMFPAGKDRARLGDVLLLLHEMLGQLSALSGLVMESMTRGPGWRFLDMGRRLERALNTLQLLRTTLAGAPAEPASLLEALLEIADSAMTYRFRYMTSLQLAPALDLLLVDETNPRSVGFQLQALGEHVRHLPTQSLQLAENAETQMVLQLQAVLRLADVEALAALELPGMRGRLASLLGDLTTRLCGFSESVTRTYLTHTAPSRPLGLLAPINAA